MEFQETCDGIYSNNYIKLAIPKENGIDLSKVLMERKQILIYIWKRLKTGTDEILSELKGKNKWR